MAEEKSRGQVTAVWFAAGTAALLACLERAFFMSLVTHWHVWVFLTLNLLLLAVLFTSTYQNTSDEVEKERDDNTEYKAEDTTKRRKQCTAPENADGDEEYCTKLLNNVGGIGMEEDEIKIVGEDVKKEDHQLSKEELNERVEAFIANFRKQLRSDAKGNNSCRIHERGNMTFEHVMPSNMCT